MPIHVARIIGLPLRPTRVGSCVSFVALLLAISCNNLQNATAEGDTRTISFHHIHTDEDLTITYKVNGRYDEEALKKINYELRDWRKNETIEMDPHLIDLVWEVHRDVGSTDPIQVVCGYRSPDTNAMLRRRSSGVAKFSQHMLGKAMDFYLTGVPLEHIRAVGLYLERGGVGFYPTSGSPFVHLDTGNVRHWPAIAANDMPRLMEEGQQLAAAGDKNGDKVQVAHNTHPTTAPAVVATTAPAVVASLSGSHATPDQDASPPPRTDAHIAVVPTKPVAVAKPQPAKPTANTYEVASAESRPVQLRPAQQASLFSQSSANEVINQADYWQGLQPNTAPQASTQANTNPNTNTDPAATSARASSTQRRQVASAAPADTQVTASLAPWPMPDRGAQGAGALAYADPKAAVTVPRVSPMGTATAKPVAPPDTTVALKRSGDKPSVIAQPPGPALPPTAKIGDRFDDPWLRAMIVSPSAQSFMSASMFGGADYLGYAPLLQKPVTSVMMTFSTNPQLDMTTTRFSGTAVVFVSTVTFGARTASLR